jgi:hypothetical protein
MVEQLLAKQQPPLTLHPAANPPSIAVIRNQFDDLCFQPGYALSCASLEPVMLQNLLS